MTSTKELLKKYDITPNKALGQNFLSNQAALNKIIEEACIDGKNVLEIGPGLGALTRELVLRAKAVTAVEIDAKMVKVLSDIEGLNLIHQDFLKTDVSEVFGGENFIVAANLPYYVTTPICMKLLDDSDRIESMTLMLQKEAAQRFFAPVGSKKYGPMTILANRSYNITRVLELSPSDYFPMPDVDSWVIHLEKKQGVQSMPQFSKLLDRAFLMRRKTLVNNLMSGGILRSEAEELVQSAGLPLSVRAEAVTIEQFEKLVR
ncbi:MAG: ribosomal RNA small subunit methyltransferase A [Clostridia bacterium]|nr:ribosomal RNA small subunit methyltransferase A [Clostridia bacterium]